MSDDFDDAYGLASSLCGRCGETYDYIDLPAYDRDCPRCGELPPAATIKAVKERGRA